MYKSDYFCQTILLQYEDFGTFAVATDNFLIMMFVSDKAWRTWRLQDLGESSRLKVQPDKALQSKVGGEKVLIVVINTNIFIHLYPSSSIFINIYPSSSIFIHLYPSLSIFIHLHPSSSLFIIIYLSLSITTIYHKSQRQDKYSDLWNQMLKCYRLWLLVSEWLNPTQ